MADCNNHQNNFQWHRDELKVTGSDVGVEKKKIGDTFLNSSEKKGSSREMNRILLVWKGRNQIFHLHFSQYCLEHLHLQKHSTFLQLVEPNGVEANLEVAFALLSALGTCFKTDIWVWSWTVMLLPWQSKRNKIRHTLCCEVGCAATEHIFIACQSSHQAPELQNTTSHWIPCTTSQPGYHLSYLYLLHYKVKESKRKNTFHLQANIPSWAFNSKTNLRALPFVLCSTFKLSS